MLKDIHDISKPVGLMMYLEKSEVMCEKHVNKNDLLVDVQKVNEVDRYKKRKRELDRNGVHSLIWKTQCKTKICI